MTRGLAENELVDDRALEDAAEDAFGHVDFVDELVAVTSTIKTPANVALFGSWGSGKSSLGRLLEQRFDKDSRVQFVRFDALKYREVPLRRHFISYLAKKLGEDDPKYSSGLYQDTVTNNLNFPPGLARKLVRYYLTAFAGLMALMAALAFVYALAATGDFEKDLKDAIEWLAPAAFLPAALLSALAALVGNQFKVEHRVQAPQTDEQFEQCFKDLVQDVLTKGCLAREVDDKKKRLVVFIDELDRCAPDHVASILETLRTFLEVKGCVFVVAADQQALEEALTRKVRQATPANAVTPYYSAGSAYLDKIFQLQMALPSLKPQRLTTFALGLVQEKQGVWAELREAGVLDDVISVLIPSHVSGPRRVKALLNHFALLYRLAQTRAEDGDLSQPISARAAELAKLACLRLEFPLFAADLVIDPRMPDLVIEAAEALREGRKGTFPTAIPVEATQRADRWAAGVLDTDVFLATGSHDPAEAEDAEDERNDESPVRRSHASQLVRYLHKTARIPGPGRDLIYLESAGADLPELDPQVADQLETIAVDGDESQAEEIVATLSEVGQRSAVLLVSRVVRHSAVGIEGSNAVGVLFRVLGSVSADITPVADEAARAISSHDPVLEAEHLVGAFLLSLKTRIEGDALRKKVFDRSDWMNAPNMSLLVVTHARKVERDDVVGTAFHDFLTAVPEQAAQILAAQDEKDAVRTLHSWSNDRVSPDLVPSEEQSLEFLKALRGIGTTATYETALAIFLALAQPAVLTEARDGDELLEVLKTRDGQVCVLERARSDSPQHLPAWLRYLPADKLDPEARDALNGLALHAANYCWSGYLQGSISDSHFDEFINSLKPFADRKPFEWGHDFLAQATSQLPNPCPVELVPSLRARYGYVESVVELTSSPRSAVSNEVMSSLGVLVASNIVGQPDGRDVGEHALNLVDEYGSDADDANLRQLTEQVFNSPIWPGWSQTISIVLSRLLKEPSPFSQNDIAALAQNHRISFSRGLSEWLDMEEPSGAVAWLALQPFAVSTPPVELRQSINALVNAWDKRDGGTEHLSFLEALIGDNVVPSHEFLNAVRISAKASDVVRLISTRYKKSPNISVGRRLLALVREMTIKKTEDQRALSQDFLIPFVKSQDPEILDVFQESLSALRGYPRDRREAIRTQLRKLAEQQGRTQELEDRLHDAGWVKRSKRLFGTKQEDV